VGSESISDTCNIHSGCYVLWKLKPILSPHSHVIQSFPIHWTTYTNSSHFQKSRQLTTNFPTENGFNLRHIN